MLHICRRAILHLEVFCLVLPHVDWLIFESMETETVVTQFFFIYLTATPNGYYISINLTSSRLLLRLSNAA